MRIVSRCCKYKLWRWLSYVQQEDPLKDLHTSSSDQEPPLPFSLLNKAFRWTWLMRCCWSTKHCLYSSLLFLVQQRSISIAAQTLHVLYCPAKTVFEITLVLTYKPYSELQCSVWCRHTSLHVFVLQGDECIMLHCFYNGSNATFWYHCHCLILSYMQRNIYFTMNI